MEKLSKKGTKRLLYLRQRTLSDGDMKTILSKKPNEMSENEKVIWKVEVFKECEDTEDYLNEKIRDIEEQKVALKNLITDAKNLIVDYQDAVDRIGKKAQEIYPKPSSSLKLELEPPTAQDLKSQRGRIRSIVLDDVDAKTFIYGKPKKYFSNMSQLELRKDGENQSYRSHQVVVIPEGKKWETSKQLGTDDVPEVFNRLYQHDSRHNCEACKNGHAQHNHPEKKKKMTLHLSSGKKKRAKSRASSKKPLELPKKLDKDSRKISAQY